MHATRAISDLTADSVANLKLVYIVGGGIKDQVKSANLFSW
jgi:hypothetical protein